MRLHFNQRVAACVGLLAAGCGQAPAIWSSPLAMSAPMRVGASVMWVDTTRGLVFALDPAASPPSVKRVAVGRGASFASPSPARDTLLLLTPGREALLIGQQAEDPALTVVAPPPSGTGGAPSIARTYPLKAPFDRLAVSPDGALAVAYFSDSPASDPRYFRNPNELAVIDLGAPPSATNPSFRTIRSLGAAPLGVVFSPPLAIPSGASDRRTIALVLSPNYLTLIDLAHLDRPEITVPLVADGSDATVTPAQVIFDAQGADATAAPTVYVRADGSDDIYALALEARATMDPMENDWLPHLNQPSAGATPRDMLFYRDAGSAFLLLATDGGQLALIDAATSEFATIDVGAPVDAILPVPAAEPTMAILYSRASPQSFVHFLDLAGLDTRRERNLSPRTLARPVHELVPVPGDQQLLVLHDDTRTVISILDLGPRRTDTPILGQVPLGSFDFVGVGYLVAVSDGLARLGVLDLTTLNPTDFRLDATPRRVVAVGNQLVVDHGVPEGMATVVPAPTATRDEATVLWGFFLDGVLAERLED
jgi:hypothetical protein